MLTTLTALIFLSSPAVINSNCEERETITIAINNAVSVWKAEPTGPISKALIVEPVAVIAEGHSRKVEYKQGCRPSLLTAQGDWPTQ